MRVLLVAALLTISAWAGPPATKEGIFAALRGAPKVKLSSYDSTANILLSPNSVQRSPILGSVWLRGQEKASLLEARLKGVQESKGKRARCFTPRHQVDIPGYRLLICFECWAIEVSCDDDTRFTLTTTASPQKLFNQILKRHHIPLAP